jgi:Protein of unknwon function (DUF3008)
MTAMPAKSEKQRKAAGAALAAKRRGSTQGLGGAAKSMASMSEDDLEDFARKPGGKSSGGGHGKHKSRPR